MKADELKDRTKKFALRILKMVRSLPKTREADVIGKQLLRCGTSVAANYRAACRARSQADFISKVTIVEEESDESAFWMELIIDAEILKKNLVEDLLKEANELTAIFTASGKTARTNKNPQSKIRNPQ
ncbi:MAG: four helix bundle protein [Bacteroidetes bacterium]|nr:four helix bundle protein [Bacteroidota bacterium]